MQRIESERVASFLVERRNLAHDLQRLRLASGQSTYDLAERLGVSQSKVSKIENGRVAVAAADAEAWAFATGVSVERAAELTRRAEAALVEAVTWRASAQEGLAARQREIALIEREATTIRSFATAVVSGLLQTADYARHIFLEAHPDSPDVPAAVAARIERQATLYDDGKTFEFLFSEAALYGMPRPRALGLAQLDRMRSVATLPTVRIGVIPLDAFGWAWHEHAFTLYESGEEGEGIAHVETLTAVVNVTDPAGVQAYRAAFERLRAVAKFGDAALSRIDRVMREMRERKP